ncbi:MAG TPA: FkbM family methyltransferase [Puia sp.]|nr:FkbM family methyltransferase [Puia sp.]
MTDRKLIFDVGANDGMDTAYYLGLGHSVVAVEADPSLCDQIRGRFAQEITDRRLTVVNAAVMEEERETVVLYVSKDNTESSLIRLMAERSGLSSRILVAGRSLCSLFSEYGVPWYCKIDIEGYDPAAVRAMSSCIGRPAYISCEGTGQPIGDIIGDERFLYTALDALAAQGYRWFKLVDQESLLVLGDGGHYDRLHRWPVRIRTKLERWMGRRGLPGAGFISGPFGEELAGEWTGYDVTRQRMRRHFYHYYQYTKNKQNIFWVDIHGKY